MVRLGRDDFFDTIKRATCGAFGTSFVTYCLVRLNSHAKRPEIGWIHLGGFFEILNRVVVTMRSDSAASCSGVSFIGVRIETERDVQLAYGFVIAPQAR